jgi:hypothetical protein
MDWKFSGEKILKSKKILKKGKSKNKKRGRELEVKNQKNTNLKKKEQ